MRTGFRPVIVSLVVLASACSAADSPKVLSITTKGALLADMPAAVDAINSYKMRCVSPTVGEHNEIDIAIDVGTDGFDATGVLGIARVEPFALRFDGDTWYSSFASTVGGAEEVGNSWVSEPLDQEMEGLHNSSAVALMSLGFESSSLPVWSRALAVDGAELKVVGREMIAGVGTTHYAGSITTGALLGASFVLGSQDEFLNPEENRALRVKVDLWLDDAALPLRFKRGAFTSGDTEVGDSDCTVTNFNVDFEIGEPPDGEIRQLADEDTTELSPTEAGVLNRRADNDVKRRLNEALVAAKVIYAISEDYTAATPEELEYLYPANYTAGPTAAPYTFSLASTEDVIVLAALSDTGICFLIRDQATGSEHVSTYADYEDRVSGACSAVTVLDVTDFTADGWDDGFMTVSDSL